MTMTLHQLRQSVRSLSRLSALPLLALLSAAQPRGNMMAPILQPQFQRILKAADPLLPAQILLCRPGPNLTIPRFQIPVSSNKHL